ncbi:hypothetical protein AAEU32_11965 [Pseudoalteromonas sp. SSDWG2]|uniref:hypothetical protein n=1 Tax=Pseudoalteromonas sp. SSDWG2 TaxID=3139391 RepID=UPI003BAA61E5
MTIRAITQSVQPNPSVNPKAGSARVGQSQQQTPTPRQDQVNDSQQGRALADSLYRKTIYDQPQDSRTSKAISTYKEYAYLERREEVKAMLNVSVYA